MGGINDLFGIVSSTSSVSATALAKVTEDRSLPATCPCYLRLIMVDEVDLDEISRRFRKGITSEGTLGSLDSP